MFHVNVSFQPGWKDACHFLSCILDFLKFPKVLQVLRRCDLEIPLINEAASSLIVFRTHS